YGQGRLTVCPRLARCGVPMGPSMREEQSHLRPAHIQLGTGRVRQSGNTKKAADIEAGEGRARHDPAERAAQAGRHVFEGACGIAAPVHRSALRARVARTSPDQAVVVYFHRRLKDGTLEVHDYGLIWGRSGYAG